MYQLNFYDHFNQQTGRLLLETLMAVFIFLPGAAYAGSVENNDGQNDSGQTSEVTASSKAAEMLIWQKEQVESQVQNAARWLDSFFGDPDYDAEVASSQFRFRPEIYYNKEQGADPGAKVSLKLHLPNLNRKVSLVIGNNPDNTSFNDSIDDNADESVIGLQFFGKARKHWHTSLSTGIKFNEFAAYIGPRARYFKHVNERTAYRFSQAVRWQTNNYWQIISRLDFNYVVNNRYVFRQTFDGRWRGEKSADEGYRTRLSSIVTKRLRHSAGLQYEFTTIFNTRPDTHVNSYTVAVRYRRRTSHDWLYYEIVPQVTFEDEFDYAFNPGIRLRLEFFYGTDFEKRFWKHEPEDTEEFYW
jgi:hypothetical protein